MENNVAEMKLATLQSIEVYRDDVAVVIEVSQMKQYQIITFLKYKHVHCIDKQFIDYIGLNVNNYTVIR